jgi:hypothetical protein
MPMSYVSVPQVKTKTELEIQRKTASIIANQKIKINSRSQSNPVEQFSNNFLFNQLSENKKKKLEKNEDLQNFKQKFDKRIAGIHGKELPKFSEHLQDYWKFKDGYCEKPPVREKTARESRPISEFCRLRVKKSKNDLEITKKPGEINPFPTFTPREGESAGMRNTSRSRFSDELLLTSRVNSTISIEIGNSSLNSRAFHRPRPFTANFKSGKMKRVIRSSGFL